MAKKSSWQKTALSGFLILLILVWLPFLFLSTMDDFPFAKAFWVPVIISGLFLYFFYRYLITRPRVQKEILVVRKLFLGIIPQTFHLQRIDVVSIEGLCLAETSDALKMKKEDRPEIEKITRDFFDKLHEKNMLSAVQDKSFALPKWGESMLFDVRWIKIKDKQGREFKIKIQRKDIAKEVDSWLISSKSIDWKLKIEFSTSTQNPTI